MKSIAELKAKARGSLTGRYAAIMIAFMLARLIANLPSLLISSMTVSNPIISEVIDVTVALIVSFITAIFVVGHNHICLLYARTKELVPVSEMWHGFRGMADQIIITYFLVLIRLLLPTVPFIASAYFVGKDPSNMIAIMIMIAMLVLALIATITININYALVLFLILDHPEENPATILQMSKEMMKGFRLKYFWLQISFVGMYILSILTFGFGMFWVYPYVKMTNAQFYLMVVKAHEPETQTPVLDGDPNDPNYYKEVY